MKHVLVIDDDAEMRRLISEHLTLHAFKVTAVADSQHMKRILMVDPADVVVIDLNLGGEDGIEIVRNLSAKSNVPIIIISGDRCEEADKVLGLELGAADFIAKPFGTREFLARVRVALRGQSNTYRTKDRRTFSFNNWTLNLKRRRLTTLDNVEIKLTAGEFNLLVAFLEKPREVLSRDELLTASRVHDEEVYDRSVDVLILRLRRKLEHDSTNPQLIRTARGVGYFFDADVSVSYWRSMAA
ncbi:response regulator [Rhizobium leguminosarum]|uniref:response regulator n=1 Tax=Rhizobium leguminosarum TaxID=384 RepID=UPI0028F45644|nr:response regulator [Rhizobium leguminosarum]